MANKSTKSSPVSKIKLPEKEQSASELGYFLASLDPRNQQRIVRSWRWALRMKADVPLRDKLGRIFHTGKVK